MDSLNRDHNLKDSWSWWLKELWWRSPKNVDSGAWQGYTSSRASWRRHHLLITQTREFTRPFSYSMSSRGLSVSRPQAHRYPAQQRRNHIETALQAISGENFTALFPRIALYYASCWYMLKGRNRYKRCRFEPRRAS